MRPLPRSKEVGESLRSPQGDSLRSPQGDWELDRSRNGSL